MPPAARRAVKAAAGGGGSEAAARVERRVRGLLNRLAEANIQGIVRWVTMNCCRNAQWPVDAWREESQAGEAPNCLPHNAAVLVVRLETFDVPRRNGLLELL